MALGCRLASDYLTRPSVTEGRSNAISTCTAQRAGEPYEKAGEGDSWGRRAAPASPRGIANRGSASSPAEPCIRCEVRAELTPARFGPAAAPRPQGRWGGGLTLRCEQRAQPADVRSADTMAPTTPNKTIPNVECRVDTAPSRSLSGRRSQAGAHDGSRWSHPSPASAPRHMVPQPSAHRLPDDPHRTPARRAADLDRGWIVPRARLIESRHVCPPHGNRWSVAFPGETDESGKGVASQVAPRGAASAAG
jgi:hypothetical protein